MNGELYQICCITAAAKKALQDNTDILYTPQKYVFRTEFCFLPEEQLFGQRNYTAPNVEKWFENCRKKKLQDVKFLAPISVGDPNFWGYTDMPRSSIVCFYEGGEITYFTVQWEFDSVREWEVMYTENEWKNPPSGKPHFEDNTKTLGRVLEDIRELAVQIDCSHFAKTFQEALDILNSQKAPADVYKLDLPQLPAKNMPMFAAAGWADVFGGMGSWNDDPAYFARNKGLAAEYDQLSGELLKNIRLAVLYAVNEW